jgi:hypothetical protein
MAILNWVLYSVFYKDRKLSLYFATIAPDV